MFTKRYYAVAIIVGLALLAISRPVFSETKNESQLQDAKLQETYQQMVDRAVRYLGNKGQSPDGSYSSEAGPGITAIVTTAILRTGRTPQDPFGRKELEISRRFSYNPTAAIYQPGSLYRNYEDLSGNRVFLPKRISTTATTRFLADCRPFL